MLPKVSPPSMECASAEDTSYPPDICLKSACTRSGADTAPWQLDRWPNAMDIKMESHEVDEPPITQADLVMSACSEEEANNSSGGSSTLPDLCGGATELCGAGGSIVEQEVSDKSANVASFNHCYDLSDTVEQNVKYIEPHSQNSSNTDSSKQTLSLEISSSSCESLASSQEPVHLALGAKPKIFKYKIGNRNRTDGDLCDENVKHCSSSRRTTDTSSVDFFSKSQIVQSIDDQSVNNYTKQVCSQSALTNCDTNENEVSVLENTVSLADDVDTVECNSESCADEVQSSSEQAVCDPAREVSLDCPVDDFLLHNTRAINLVACGIWDCDSQQVVPEEEVEVPAGLVLIRNNLHSASHPMFTKWPCEAYIPSHILIEVAFNSHGTSLGAYTVCLNTLMFIHTLWHSI